MFPSKRIHALNQREKFIHQSKEKNSVFSPRTHKRRRLQYCLWVIIAGVYDLKLAIFDSVSDRLMEKKQAIQPGLPELKMPDILPIVQNVNKQLSFWTMPNNANGTITRLDIVVSNDSFASLCSGAAEVVSLVKNWKRDLIDFELFKDGITNHLLKCFMKDDPDNAVLIRVYGEKTELFIDRDLEVRNMQMMCDAGLCAPLYCAFANGLCYGYSPGEVLDTKMVRDPGISRLIARRLAKMHSVRLSANGVVPQPSLFPVLHKYLQLIPESFSDPIKDERLKSCIPSKDILEKEIQSLKENLLILDSPVVFSHNDLLLKNVIYNKEKDDVTFIDYEYADYNYQALDIGNHFCEFAGVDKYEPSLYPDKEFQMKWLREYLEAWYLVNGDSSAVTEDAVEVLYIQVNKFSLAAHLFWGTWALIQATHSTLDFDFLGYAKERIDEYFARKPFLSIGLKQNGKETNDH